MKMTRITPRLSSLLTIWFRWLPNFYNCVIRHNCKHETLLSYIDFLKLQPLHVKPYISHGPYHGDAVQFLFPVLSGYSLLLLETRLLFQFHRKSSRTSSFKSFIFFPPLLIRKLLYCYLH